MGMQNFEQGKEYIAEAKDALSQQEQADLKALKDDLNNDTDNISDATVLGTANKNLLDKLEIINISEKIETMTESISDNAELSVGIDLDNDFSINPDFKISSNMQQSLRGNISKLKQILEANNKMISGNTDKQVLDSWLVSNYDLLPFFQNLNIQETSMKINGDSMDIWMATVDKATLKEISKHFSSWWTLSLTPRSTNDVATEEVEKTAYDKTAALITTDWWKSLMSELNTQINSSADADKWNLYLRANRALVYINALEDNDTKGTVTIDLASWKGAIKPGIEAETFPKTIKKTNIGVAGSGLESVAENMPPNNTIFYIEEKWKIYQGVLEYHLHWKKVTQTLSITYSNMVQDIPDQWILISDDDISSTIGANKSNILNRLDWDDLVSLANNAYKKHMQS